MSDRHLWIGVLGAILALCMGFYGASMLDHATRLQHVEKPR